MDYYQHFVNNNIPENKIELEYDRLLNESTKNGKLSKWAVMAELNRAVEKYRKYLLNKEIEEKQKQREQNIRYEIENHNKYIQRLREDQNLESNSLFNALGISVPNGIIKNAIANDRAKEDINTIFKRAGTNDISKLDDKDRKQVEGLQEVILKTDSASKVVNKLADSIGVDGAEGLAGAASAAIPVIGAVVVVVKSIIAAIQQVNKSGKESVEIYKETQNALSSFGKVLNTEKSNLTELESNVDTKARKIHIEFNDLFVNFYAGLLRIKSGFLDIVGFFADGINKVKQFDKDNSENVGYSIVKGIFRGVAKSLPLVGGFITDAELINTIGENSIKSENDTGRFNEYKNYIDDLKTINSDLSDKFTDEELLSLLGNNMKDILESGSTTDAGYVRYRSIVENAANSRMWDIYKLDQDSISEFISGLVDSTVNGQSMPEYGIDTSDNTLAGYLYENGLNPVLNMYSENELESLRTRLLNEQLNADNIDSLREQNKLWKEQGALINAASGALLGFEEVNTLNGKRTGILDAEAANDVINGTEQELNDAIDRTEQKVINDLGSIADNGSSKFETSYSGAVDRVIQKLREGLVEIHGKELAGVLDVQLPTQKDLSKEVIEADGGFYRETNNRLGLPAFTVLGGKQSTKLEDILSSGRLDISKDNIVNEKLPTLEEAIGINNNTNINVTVAPESLIVENEEQMDALGRKIAGHISYLDMR